MGVLQFDMWGVTPSKRWDWAEVKSRIAKHGVRNSLLLAPMPTASTAQILGNNECFEPYTSNLYTRRVLAGEFAIVNKHLLKDLLERGLWTDEIRNQIIAHSGSVQNIPEIPTDLKELYKTCWEMKMRTRAAQDAIKFTVDQGSLKAKAAKDAAAAAPTPEPGSFAAAPPRGRGATLSFLEWRAMSGVSA